MKGKIKRFLRGQTFLAICSVAVIFTFFGPKVLEFETDNQRQQQAEVRQEQMLKEIKQTQTDVNNLNDKIVILTETNTKLVGSVCILKKQVESLGAIPVETETNCSVN